MKSAFRTWRKLAVFAFCFAGLALNANSAPESRPAKRPVANTPSGMLIGERTGGVDVFKGIPYALPPVGARRWRDAEAAQAWAGPRIADRFGPDCMQSSTMEVLDKPETDFWYHPPSLTSEDCLYLNVWTPAQRGHGKLPVMVWIHGGGEVQGAGSWQLYDGARLARKGVVLVTINYRLGIFARFAHPALSAEHAQGASGSYDLSDQIQALRWVHAHIQAFGGDPANVTIFGQSSGGMYVAALMASPRAAGLFQRAIGQSGAAFRDALTPRAVAEDAGIRFMAAADVADLSQLREMPAAHLHALERGAKFYLPPVVDGYHLLESPCETFLKGRHNAVPLLAGFTREEHYGYKPPPPLLGSHRAFADFTRSSFAEIGYGGNIIDDFIALLPASRSWDAQAGFAVLRHYGVTGWETDSWAAMNSRQQANTYLYYFAHRPPGAQHAFHTAEISYVFDNERYSRRYSPNMPAAAPRKEDRALSDAMSARWIAFARGGSPNVPGLPAWQRYGSQQQRRFMEFAKGLELPGQNFFPALRHSNICEAVTRR